MASRNRVNYRNVPRQRVLSVSILRHRLWLASCYSQ